MKQSIKSIQEAGKEPFDKKKAQEIYYESKEYLTKFENAIKKTRPAFIG